MTNTLERTGVVLVNVGTPDGPTPSQVRRYLREFLGDPRVLDSSPLVRALVLNLVILPFRPRKSAEAYAKIWTPEGSPLLINAERLRLGLARALGERFEVVVGMRYGRPSIAAALDALRSGGIHRIVLFPLFPQYASATTGTALEAAYLLAASRWNTPSLSVVPPFFADPPTLDAIADVGRPHVSRIRADHVLMSFHGLPERQIRKSDDTGRHCLQAPSCCDTITAANGNCYRAQCVATARAIAERLRLEDDRWSLSFQSRLGRVPWIRPYTDEVVDELARRGVRRLAVFTPAFVADCLETLEEIGMRARDGFLRAGGESFALVPCLNDHAAWIEAAASLVRRAAGMTPRPLSGR